MENVSMETLELIERYRINLEWLSPDRCRAQIGTEWMVGATATEAVAAVVEVVVARGKAA
jgi:hypothetical protein